MTTAAIIRQIRASHHITRVDGGGTITLAADGIQIVIVTTADDCGDISIFQRLDRPDGRVCRHSYWPAEDIGEAVATMTDIILEEI